MCKWHRTDAHDRVDYAPAGSRFFAGNGISPTYPRLVRKGSLTDNLALSVDRNTAE